MTRLEELAWGVLHVGGFLLAMFNMSCGDDWPKAIEIGVSVGRDAGVVCVEVDGGELRQIDCPDAGGDR
jgi:hypothetical protein